MSVRRDGERSLNSQEFLIKQTMRPTVSDLAFGVSFELTLTQNTCLHNSNKSTYIRREQGATFDTRVKRTRGYLLAEPDLGAGHWPHLPHVALLAAQGPGLAETEIHWVIVKLRHGSW